MLLDDFLHDVVPKNMKAAAIITTDTNCMVYFFMSFLLMVINDNDVNEESIELALNVLKCYTKDCKNKMT